MGVRWNCWVPEDSYLILGIPRTDAISLGYDFGQNAIVVGRIGNPAELCGLNF